uniref:CUB domain-containing protein n=1 Tax=Romanomermis culicivorax TaxID=13658 RepID=A0A915KEG8_ROMCU
MYNPDDGFICCDHNSIINQYKLEKSVKKQKKLNKLSFVDENLYLKDDFAKCRAVDWDIAFAVIIVCVMFACHQEFVQDFAESGNFSSLNFPQRYPPNLECVYTFVAKPNNRIEMTFQEFDLETSIPRCEHYLDLYAEVEGTFDFLTEKLSGRFCGTVSPGMRISMFNVIVLVFHARGQKSGKGFRGAFKFVPADKYKLSPGKSCDVTIRSTESAEGSLFSPTYPGKYPSNLICNYKLLGRPGERIRLYFKDFDLYFGGQHCPYDSVTIYDGDSDNYPIIQKVCGLQQTLELYSRSAHLHLVFQSTDPPYSEHRGFEIVYSFNRTLVDIVLDTALFHVML